MEDGRKKAKRLLITGLVAGGILGLTVSLLMDILYADSLQGTWRVAIARDVHNFFSISTSPDSLVVYIIYAFILFVLTVFGALLGAVFFFLMYRFFLFLGDHET